METVLLKLEAPLQSWSGISLGQNKTTLERPSKSGITGIIASAMGRSRSDDISDIAGMKFSVVQLRKGLVIDDLQTRGGNTARTLFRNRVLNPKLGATAGYGPAKGVSEIDLLFGTMNAAVWSDTSLTSMSERKVLSDYSFMVGLTSSDSELVQRVHDSMESPKRAIFLGRKGYLPSEVISQRIIAENQDWIHSEEYSGLTWWRESAPGEGTIAYDYPLSFESTKEAHRGSSYRGFFITTGANEESTP